MCRDEAFETLNAAQEFGKYVHARLKKEVDSYSYQINSKNIYSFMDTVSQKIIPKTVLRANLGVKIKF